MKKINLIFNDDVKIKGILLQEKEDQFIVKLSNGYQVILEKSKCSDVEIINEKENNKIKNSGSISNSKKNPSLPNIAIFHTGGTIASKVDYETGAVSSKFTPDELINLFKELEDKANLEAFMIGNLMSEDMRFGHYNMILESIKSYANKFDGIIVSHGTDTMHYSSAALQYSIENLNIPIILVGAQRSSDRASSDAFLNLQAAIEFISYNKNLKKNNKKSFNRVAICMHKTINDDDFLILDSINVRKNHSSKRDAFEQVNFNPVCTITKEFEIKNIREELFTISSKEELKFTSFNEKLKIGVFYAHPHLHHEEIERLTFYDGVVIAGTGLGHIGLSEFDEISKDNIKNFEAIKKVAKSMPITLALQPINGKVNVNVYSSGRRLLESGVLGNYSSLTIETQFAKLAYLLSKHKKIDNEIWMKNLEGFDSEKVVNN